MLDFETTVKPRQSIRKFLPTPMTEAEIKQMPMPRIPPLLAIPNLG